MSSSLVSLTSSLAGTKMYKDKERRASVGSKSRHGCSDMDISEDEDGEIRDDFLKEAFPHLQRVHRQSDGDPEDNWGHVISEGGGLEQYAICGGWDGQMLISGDL